MILHHNVSKALAYSSRMILCDLYSERRSKKILQTSDDAAIKNDYNVIYRYYSNAVSRVKGSKLSDKAKISTENTKS